MDDQLASGIAGGQGPSQVPRAPSQVTAAMAMLLAGCASASPHRPADHLLGFVRLAEFPTVGDVRALEISTIGGGWGGAPFLGWQRGRYVFARPGACQLLIVVRSGVEADHVRSIAQSLEGQKPCIADFSGTLSPLRPPAR